MLNNQYMGLIRQAEKYGYDQNYEVDLSFENGDTVGIAINEYEPILDGAYEHAGAVVGALPERD